MARLGIDIGGTFTDFALEVLHDGAVRHHFLKVLTTPHAPEVAVVEGTRQILAAVGLQPADVKTLVHGTTLATNAVIERRGARIAFLTTEGFRDTLEMGNESRYDHYDLHVEKPEPLVPRCLRLTVRERLASDGKVLVPLDEEGLRELLPSLDEARVEAVAIGFLHSFANPEHERRAAELLRAWRPGIRVSLSCEVAPEIREYERFATVCANAYVQPVMAGYLERLEREMETLGISAPLMLMLSNGGLCEAEVARRFPVRLLESGPAGGAILAAHVARTLRLERALLVDIGGTTAKLCFIDHGVPQTARSMEVARIARFKAGSGIPLRFPVIELAEIGAGGGSIAHRDTLGRLQVGPESASSVPGPACYGRGGTAATVTDAHLLLGRIDPDEFGGGKMKLDSSAAQRAYEQLGDALGMSAQDAAWSVCEIVDENMANAVREHAVEVGKGLDGRTLIAIGGMAPLHGARLAAKLGLDHVIIPVGAGVGSALGFLRAPVSFEATRSVLLCTAQFDPDAANAIVDDLIADLRQLVRRAASTQPMTEHRMAWMRYKGQGHEIRVPLPSRRFQAGDGESLRQAFEAAYHASYGRTVEAGQVEILGWTIRVEASDAQATHAPRPGHSPAARSMDAASPRFRDAFDQGARTWKRYAVHRIAELGHAAPLPAPALLATNETTVVVPLGFSFAVGTTGELQLARDQDPVAQGSTVAGTEMPTSIRLQVLWDRLNALVEEQARTMMRTAFSPTVREAGDLAAGLFDLQGRLVVQAVTGTPGHVNSLAACTVHFLKKYPLAEIREGDHFITNDPWLASGHLHDITVMSPVFQAGRPIGFFACTCHQVDIGGLGMGPDASSVYEEGLQIPMLKLARKGQLNEDLLDMVRVNVRQPEAVIGDILSYVTANENSGRRLAATLDELGETGLDRISSFVCERSAAGMRAAIEKLPYGTFRHSMELDGYDTPVHVECQVTISADGVSVTFDGTSAASQRGINLVLNYTRAYASFGVRAAVAPSVPNNAGSLALVEVNAPVGSILNVERPAPVCARHIIGQFLPEVVLGALSGAMPDSVPAEGAACNWGLQLRGHHSSEQPQGFEILFFNSGGSGARPDSDGLSATCFPSGIRSIPVEICESVAPIVIWKKELLPGSGGAGKWRGGLGQRVEVSTRDGSSFQFFGLFDRVRNPARGRHGGMDGAPGWVGLTTGKALKSLGLQTVPAGEVLRIDVPGGAGFGCAEAREDDARRRDAEMGYAA